MRIGGNSLMIFPEIRFSVFLISATTKARRCLCIRLLEVGLSQPITFGDLSADRALCR